MICSKKGSSSWWLFNRPFPLPWKIGDLQEIEESREGGEPGKGVRKETTHGAGCNARWFQWSTFSGFIGASRYTGLRRVAGEVVRLLGPRLSRIFPANFWVDDDFHKAFPILWWDMLVERFLEGIFWFPDRYVFLALWGFLSLVPQ